MFLLESTSEIAIGVAVEAFVFTIAAGIVYRVFSGRFLIPKREMVLPNQRGVIVEGDRIVRIADPGPAWIRPKQRIILCDMRVRPIQLAGIEVIGADNGVVRVSLNAEYRIADAGIYYGGSSNANDAFFVQLRRALVATARRQMSGNIVALPEAFAASMKDALTSEVARLGFEVTALYVNEAVSLGRLRHAVVESSSDDNPPDTLVH